MSNVESGLTALAKRVGVEIKSLKAASIVADVVAVYDNTASGNAGTETDIAHYSTDVLTDNDVVLVLKDETHDKQKAYYRWNGTAFVFEVAEDKVEHPIATTTEPGAVQPDGTTITIADGVISYNLPAATNTTLGGVIIDKDGGLEVTDTGKVSVKASALPIASDTTLGAIKVPANSGLEVSATGELTVKTSEMPVASTTQLGVVQVGDGLSVTAAGVLSVNSTTLPVATATTLGVVKVGDGLSVTAAGVLSVNSTTLPVATTTSLGAVKVGDGLSVTSAGVLSVNSTTLPTATKLKTGVVQIGTGMTVTTAGVVDINPQSPLGFIDNYLGLPDYTEEVWELTMEDGSVVKRKFLVNTNTN